MLSVGVVTNRGISVMITRLTNVKNILFIKYQQENDMKLNWKTFKKWAIKIIVLLVVLAMVFAGFVVIFWKL